VVPPELTVTVPLPSGETGVALAVPAPVDPPAPVPLPLVVSDPLVVGLLVVLPLAVPAAPEPLSVDATFAAAGAAAEPPPKPPPDPIDTVPELPQAASNRAENAELRKNLVLLVATETSSFALVKTAAGEVVVFQGGRQGAA
jgi:hypothetical protein